MSEVYITAIRVANPGNHPSLVTHVKWLQLPKGKAGSETIASAVKWEEEHGDGYVGGPSGKVKILVAVRNGTKYLRSSPDGTTGDNLLSLPQY